MQTHVNTNATYLANFPHLVRNEYLVPSSSIEVLHGGHVACQEKYNIIPMGQNVHSNAKLFLLFLACNMAAMQNLH